VRPHFCAAVAQDPQARLSATLQAPRLVGSMLKCCACFAAKNHPSRQGSRDETAERHSLTAMPRWLRMSLPPLRTQPETMHRPSDHCAAAEPILVRV